jgi:hypothetical protein
MSKEICRYEQALQLYEKALEAKSKSDKYLRERRGGHCFKCTHLDSGMIYCSAYGKHYKPKHSEQNPDGECVRFKKDNFLLQTEKAWFSLPLADKVLSSLALFGVSVWLTKGVRLLCQLIN